MNLKIYIFIFVTFYLQNSYCQYIPLSQKLINEGYGYLKGSYYQGTPDDAKKSFIRAKQLFFYRKTIVNNANLGLSEYYLVINDSINANKTLKNIIGKSTCKKIENSQFSKIEKTKKDDWNVYNVTKKQILVALNQNEIVKAKNYFQYFKEYINVTWYCGTGSMEHSKYIEEIQMRLDEK